MATSKSFEFLLDGYKLICIAGFVNGNPVWREVGTLTLNKKGEPSISLDSTFNPAGVYKEDPESANVFLTVKPRVPYQKQEREVVRRPSGFKFNNDDLEDDIPF